MADFNIPDAKPALGGGRIALNSVGRAGGEAVGLRGPGDTDPRGTLNTTSALPGNFTTMATGAILDIDGVSNNDTFNLTSFSGSLGDEPRRVSVDDGRLRDGFHPVEDHGGAIRRWTKGKAILDRQLWSGLAQQIALLVTYDDKLTQGWIAPAQSWRESETADRPKLYAVK
jgi:hypothetical protein